MKMKKHVGRRIASLALSASMIMGMCPLLEMDAQAQYVGGNAPFINSWLVSGPYETPVVDEFTVRLYLKTPI